MSEISEKAIKLIKDLRSDIIIDIMFTPEKNAEDDSLKALVDYIAELEKALNIDADLTVAGLRVELAMATARIAELSQAVGLITTLKPTMVMDVDHPLDMAKEVEAYVTARIAELEAAQRWIPVSERLPEESGWYRVGAINVYYEGYTDEVYFEANKTKSGWQTSVRDEIYCWLDGVPELPQPPEVQE